MEILTIEPGLIIWEVIAFTGLLIVLWRFAWGPLLSILDERDKTIRNSLETAERTRIEAEEMLEDYKKQMAEAKLEAQEIIDKARQLGETANQEIIEEAKEQADKMIARTKEEIVYERDQAVRQLQKEMADLTIGLASKVINKSLSKEDHLDLIDKYLLEAGNLREN